MVDLRIEGKIKMANTSINTEMMMHTIGAMHLAFSMVLGLSMEYI